MEIRYQTPYQVAIAAFGSGAEVARICGISQPATSQWHTSGGVIPIDRARSLLEEARRRGVELSAEDLILGRVLEDEE